MSTQEKNPVVGDVVKRETSNAICRESRHITMVAGATLPLVVGEMMEPDTAVAQVDTVTEAVTIDGGTFRLGYDGQWTTALAYGESAANIQIAFHLLTTVIAQGDTIVMSAPLGDAVTITWQATGNRRVIDIDCRLLLDGTTTLDGQVTIATTTPGTAVVDMVIVATGGNTTGVLMEEVSLVELQTNPRIEKSFLIGSDGVAIVDGDNLYAIAAQLAAGITAIDALAGINVRYEPNILTSGTPEDSLP